MRDMIALRSTRGAALAAALVFTGLIGAAAPAAAQALYGVEEEDAVLAPRAVLFRLGREGYTGFGHPRFHGDTYTVEADTPWGNRVRLFVDARTGRVLDRDRLEAPLIPPGAIPGGRQPGYGWTEADIRPPRDFPRDPGYRAAPAPLPPGEMARDPASRAPIYQAPPGVSRAQPLPDEHRVAVRPVPVPERAAPPSVAPSQRATPEPNPLGLNPDAPAARRPETPRKSTKAPAKPIESPAALVEPKPALKPTAPAETKPAAAPAVATASPAPAAKSRDTEWRTPPEGRQVRVINGVTPVMGKDDPAKAAE
jgi:hypothetical protein